MSWGPHHEAHAHGRGSLHVLELCHVGRRRGHGGGEVGGRGHAHGARGRWHHGWGGRRRGLLLLLLLGGGGGAGRSVVGRRGGREFDDFGLHLEAELQEELLRVLVPHHPKLPFALVHLAAWDLEIERRVMCQYHSLKNIIK